MPLSMPSQSQDARVGEPGRRPQRHGPHCPAVLLGNQGSVHRLPCGHSKNAGDALRCPEGGIGAEIVF